MQVQGCVCISDSDPTVSDLPKQFSNSSLISLLRAEFGLSSSDLFSMTVTDYDIKRSVRIFFFSFGFKQSSGRSFFYNCWESLEQCTPNLPRVKPVQQSHVFYKATIAIFYCSKSCTIMILLFYLSSSESLWGSSIKSCSVWIHWQLSFKAHRNRKRKGEPICVLKKQGTWSWEFTTQVA